MNRFIKWFSGSVEDEKGTASFRRIDNYFLMVLVIFIVIYPTILKTLSMLHIYVLIILLVAGFLNTSVITVDNILRFFNRDKETAPVVAVPETQQATIQGDVTITNKETN